MRKIKSYKPLPDGFTVRRQTNPAVFLSSSSLDWYKLTENTRHVLNGLMTSSAKKQLEESLKEHPNLDRITGYQTISGIVAEISRDSKNFESIEAMKEILEEYAPVEIV
jgi:hypothetical protein